MDYRSYTQRTQTEVEKPGALLTKLTSPQQSPTPILTIHSPHLGKVDTQTDINDAFCQYYTDLYAVPPPVDPDTIRMFLHQYAVPQVTVAEREALRAPIATTEICEAIREMARNKNLGSDGLPVELYFIYTNHLLPLPRHGKQ
ncbi:hypothetical protein NDU88_000636 [Pleurodeles waltl]|uniref:Uncharacterized protein n=1 Tax=Pleurodeles waltl TaxID=8319 RepID=A0AAV7S6P0_PLEWA|nr:hypothetical protein NDU88_000636 [Pleurodeles waltl]